MEERVALCPEESWRPGPESNRGARICSQLRSQRNQTVEL
jgi:hypothetical protein